MCDQIAGLCIFYMLYSFWCFIYIYIPDHIYITILSISLIHRSIQIVFILFIYFTWLSCCPSSATPAQLPQFSCSSSAAPAQLPSSVFPAQLPLPPLWFATKSSIYIKSYITNHHVYFEPRFLWNFCLPRCAPKASIVAQTCVNNIFHEAITKTNNRTNVHTYVCSL